MFVEIWCRTALATLSVASARRRSFEVALLERSFRGLLLDIRVTQ